MMDIDGILHESIRHSSTTIHRNLRSIRKSETHTLAHIGYSVNKLRSMHKI